MDLFGDIRLVGVNAENGIKLLLTLAFFAIVFGVRWVISGVIRFGLRARHDEKSRFWSQQGVNLATALLLLIGLLSIWFDDPTRLATGIGLVSAGLAFALQRVITAIAGYFVILRGEMFSIGDRISMGGVRGDVVGLGFIKTTIMEMGQPPAVQSADPAMWVRSRQYTGRVVSVTNDKIFDEPVFNFSRDFPFIWEEMTIPIAYTDDRDRVEQILLDAVETHTVELTELGQDALNQLRERYFTQPVDLQPKVYYRITDNWLELTVRFITREHGVREVKDAISRDILAALDAAGIGIASATYEIVGLPPIRVVRDVPHDVGATSSQSNHLHDDAADG